MRRNFHARTKDGRYIVRLPFFTARWTLPKLANNCWQPWKGRAAKFREPYRKFMREYEDLQHMKPISILANKDNTCKCYLPHHEVLQESRTTTKLRVGFNVGFSANTIWNAKVILSHRRKFIADVRWCFIALILALLRLYYGHRENVPKNSHTSRRPRPLAGVVAWYCWWGNEYRLSDLWSRVRF